MRRLKSDSEKLLLFHSAATAATDAMITIDEQGTILFANPAVERVFGHRAEELEGTKLTRLIPEYLRALHEVASQRDQQTGRRNIPREGVQLQGLHRDGHEIPVEVSFGEFVRHGARFFTGIIRDVSERKRAQMLQASVYRISEAAHAAESLDALFRSIHGIVEELLLARNFYVALYDPAADLLSFPYFVDEHDLAPAPKKPGRGLSEYVLRTGKPLLASPEVFRTLVERGEVDQIGTDSIDWLGVPLKGRDRIIGVLVLQTYKESVRYAERDKELLSFVSTQVAHAIEHKRAQEALRASAVEYRLLFNFHPHPMWVYDPTSLAFLAVNEAAVQQYGYTREEFLGMTILDIRPVEDASAGRKAVEQSPPGLHSAGVWRHRKKGGSLIPVEIISNDLMFGGRPARLVMIHDVTERIRLETQLRQTHKFEAIGQLAGGIAHDFNNVLGAMLGWADMGYSEAPPDSMLQERFAKIRDQADRAAALTRQLLAFARRQILEPRHVNLNQLVTEVVGLLGKVIGAQVEVQTALAPDLEMTRADPSQIEQVIMNLSVNARDAMPSGGVLRLETSNMTVDAEFCRQHNWSQPGRYVQLAVSDTGVGMDAATQERIFEPFFTTKELGRGTGLGLSTVYGIVKQHEGFIHVYSEPGQGTRFHIYLPVRIGAPEMAVKTGAEKTPGGNETILVAEDHPGMRALVGETLTRLGYKVLLACDGQEAFELFQQHGNGLDLVVLDVVMPRMGGPEAYERIRAQSPEIPVVFSTGYSAEMAQLSALPGCKIPILQKPYSPRVLGQKIRELLDARGKPSPAETTKTA